MVEEFAAPWGIRLIITTFVAGFAFVGIAGVLSRRLTGKGRVAVISFIGIFAAIMISKMVIRYQIDDEAIKIQQVASAVAIPLQSLRSVAVVPNAMDGSRRTDGNEGMFSITGNYSNQSLGSYRAYVTDPVRTVVLRTSTGTVVLSPERPEEFVSRVLHRTRRFGTQ